MALSTQPDLLDHPGPWTERDYLALPEDRRRIELLDGGLLVSPSPGGPHQRLSFRLCSAIDRSLPGGLEVLEAINVRVAPGKILIPDLAVVRNPGSEQTVWNPPEVLMVIEVVSRGSAATDRAIKPALYAAGGIGYYLRIEQGDRAPAASCYRLDEGRYVESASTTPSGRLRLTEPFALDVELARLAAATKPSES